MPPPEHRNSQGRDWVRWQKAHGFLSDWLAQPQRPQLDRWLAQALRSDRKLGKKDRKWYADHIFAAVRFMPLTDFIWKSVQTQSAPPSAGLYLSFSSWMLETNCASPMKDEEIKLWPSIQETVKSLMTRSVRADDTWTDRLLLSGIPETFHDHFNHRRQISAWTPALAQSFLESQASRPPLWLRLNRQDSSSSVCEELKHHQFEVKLDADNPLAIAARGHRGIYELDCYKNGSIEIQDWASQQIGIAVAPKAGEYIWDACAGGGGKTVQIGSMMDGRGVVYASDIRAYKLKEVKRRARAAGLHHVRPFPCDASESLSFPKEVEKHQGFDAVLVDAPCSATGTWRRNPDARLRVTQAHIEELCELQFQILKNASQAVKPGGRLIYATCSWLVVENESIIERFKEHTTEFQLQNMQLWGSPFKDADTTFTATLIRDKN